MTFTLNDIDLQVTFTFEKTFISLNNDNLFLDLDLNPITLVLKHDLDIVKICVCTENEVPSFNGSKFVV